MSKSVKVASLLVSVLSACYTADELRFMVSNGMVSADIFRNGELGNSYLPQREYGQKLVRALASRFPPADNMDIVIELVHNLGSVTTTVHSQGEVGKDSILESITDGLFNITGEVAEGLKMLGILSNIDRSNTDKSGKVVQGSDIGNGKEIVEQLPYLGSPVSFMDDTIKFGKLINRDGSAMDPFVVM